MNYYTIRVSLLYRECYVNRLFKRSIAGSKSGTAE